MKTMKIRLITALLAVMMLFAAVSCSNDNNQGNDSGSQSVSETVIPYKDELPTKDYQGYDFTIHSQSRDWYHGNWTTEESPSETLSKAIFDRNKAVTNRFNVYFVETTSTKNSDGKAAIMAGDDYYDIIHCGSGVSFASQGYCLELSDLPYIDVSKEYWDNNIIDALTFAGKSFFPVGACDLTGYDYTHCLMFSKSMISNNNLENPYTLVNNDEWTYDKFSELAVAATKDVNGDGMDDGDVYGYLSQPKHVLPGFWIGAGLISVNKGFDGDPVFNMASDSRFIDAIDKAFKVTWDNDSWYRNKFVTNSNTTLNDMFANGQGLFMDVTFYYIEYFRGMKQDFGIIPYPKYDEAQRSYHSRVEGINLVCVPVTASDSERTSIILEALTSESYKTLIPAYYEVAIKTKHSRDEESKVMLDLIFENRVFDLGDTIWAGELRDGIFQGIFANNDRDLSSKLISIQEKMDQVIYDTVQAFVAVK